MSKEILFTVDYEERAIDVSVDAEIKISDLVNILVKRFEIQDFEPKLYSKNHNRPINTGKSLFEEKIWDGDILSIIR